MRPIAQVVVPPDSLLKTFRGGRHPELWQDYHDSFAVLVDAAVSLPEFVQAFYTSPLFKLERLVLRLLAGAPSSDAEVAALAAGAQNSFAVWAVGERSATQLLMCDRYGKTRSWFQVLPLSADGQPQTVLQFGSAVAARRSSTGSKRMAGGFKALLGLHRLYSRLLLRAARRGVLARRARPLSRRRTR